MLAPLLRRCGACVTHGHAAAVGLAAARHAHAARNVSSAVGLAVRCGRRGGAVRYVENGAPQSMPQLLSAGRQSVVPPSGAVRFRTSQSGAPKEPSAKGRPAQPRAAGEGRAEAYQRIDPVEHGELVVVCLHGHFDL
jgi:hypothetical protein